MAKNIELPGCLYKRGDRWYWKVQLPGEPRFKIRPMIPPGGKYATKEYHTAEKIAQDMLLRAAGNLAKAKNCYNGRMANLVALYLKHAKSYYRKPNGVTTNQYLNVERSVGYLVKHCPTMLAEDFGPRKLKDIREIMIENNLSRSTVNKYIGIIKQMFKWAASDELIPGGVYHSLQAVSGLQRGRSDARETEPVKPAPVEDVLRVLPYASKIIAAMIELQMHTGMRSSELCSMRPCDIDTNGKIWQYTPQEHKTQHFGHSKTVPLGPRCQEILRPFLLRRLDDYCFKPDKGLKFSLCPGGLVKYDSYNKDTYGRAVNRAWRQALKAGVEVARFHPHQLRHTAATIVRKEFGLDAARALLGHRSLMITDDYAEIDKGLADRAALKLG